MTNIPPDKLLEDGIDTLYVGRPDGLGCQLAVIENCLKAIEKFPTHKVIVPMERWCYFNEKNITLHPEYKFFYQWVIEKAFNINHDQLILDPWEITNRTTSNNTMFAVQWPYGLDHERMKAPLSHFDSDFCILNHIELCKEAKEIFKETAKGIGSTTVGVHARLGNGEYVRCSTENRFDRKEELFKEMDKREGADFFIASDTLSFILSAQERYGDRVFFANRKMIPEGFGPGHDPVFIGDNPSFDDEHIKNARLFARDNIDPYISLRDAMIDMLLLNSCSELICCGGAFIYHAINCKKIPTVTV